MKTPAPMILPTIAKRCMATLGRASIPSLIVTSVFCSHAQQGSPTTASPGLEYSIETIAIDTGERNVVYRTRDHVEAPNWSRDGRYLLFNLKGGIYKMPITADAKPSLAPGKKPQLLETGQANK